MRLSKKTVAIWLGLSPLVLSSWALADDPMNGGFVELRGQAVHQTDSDRTAVGGSVAAGWTGNGEVPGEYQNDTSKDKSFHVEGSIGFSGKRVIGGAEVGGGTSTCGYNNSGCKTGVYARLKLDFSDRIMEPVKGQVGLRIGDGKNYLVLGGELGAIYDRDSGYGAFLAGPAILGRKEIGSLVALEGSLEGGILAGGKSLDSKETVEDNRIKGDSKSPTENVHTEAGIVTTRTTLVKPGMEMDGVGNFQKLNLSARFRLGEQLPLYVKAMVSGSRNDIAYKDALLNDTTGDSHRIVNGEFYGGLSVGGVF